MTRIALLIVWTPPPLTRFFKNGCNGGMGHFYWKWKGEPGMGELVLTLSVLCISESFIEIKINLNLYLHTFLWCLKRFYEGVLTPLFYEDPCILTSPSLFQIFSGPLPLHPTSLSPPTPTPTSFQCPVSLAE